MANDNPQKELLEEMQRVLKRFEKAGNLAPIENRDVWDALVESQPPEERELLKELARFTDFWRYIRECKEKLELEIVDAIGQVHRLPIPERILQLRATNQKLMERIGDARQGAQFRH